MSVYKRGTKWCIGYSQQNGRWTRKVIGDTKKMAIEAEREIRRKIAREKYLGIVEPKRIYFENLCDDYLKYSKSHNEPTTFTSNKSLVRILLGRFKGKMLHEITVLEVEEYMNHRFKEVKGSTVNRAIACLKHMFNKAVEWDYLKENHLRTIRRFKEPPGRLRYLDDEEMDRLVQFSANHLRPIIVMATNTAMRKTEILNLKWKDIDLKNRMITLKKTKNNEIRTIPINDTLYVELRSINRELNHQYVFINERTGKPYIDIKTSFKTALKNAGITDFHFHDLRHHFCSKLTMAGVDIRTVQELAGHKDIRMTMRYSHLSDKHKKEAVSKIEHRTITAHEMQNASRSVGNIEIAK